MGKRVGVWLSDEDLAVLSPLRVDDESWGACLKRLARPLVRVCARVGDDVVLLACVRDTEASDFMSSFLAGARGFAPHVLDVFVDPGWVPSRTEAAGWQVPYAGVAEWRRVQEAATGKTPPTLTWDGDLGCWMLRGRVALSRDLRLVEDESLEAHEIERIIATREGDIEALARLAELDRLRAIEAEETRVLMDDFYRNNGMWDKVSAKGLLEFEAVEPLEVPEAVEEYVTPEMREDFSHWRVVYTPDGEDPCEDTFASIEDFQTWAYQTWSCLFDLDIEGNDADEISKLGRVLEPVYELSDPTA